MKTKHMTYFNLLDAVKEEGCPVCYLIKKSVHRSMDGFLYENVNDPGVREKIKRSNGFCNRHAWQLHKFGDGFGQAIVYCDLVNSTLEKLKPDRDKHKEKLCIFCEEEGDVEDRYIGIFCENINNLEFNAAYNDSSGLCLPHIELVFKKSRDNGINKKLIEIERPKLSRLLEELKEFTRKHDYRFTKEGIGKEGTSWIKAIEKISGKEGVF